MPHHGEAVIEDEPEAERASALAPFRYPIFRAVWSANLVSNFGGLIQGVGAAWMMTSIATSSYQVALVQASTTLPIMLFALVAGAIADGFDRRKVMLTAQSFMLVVSVLLAVFTYLGLMTPWTLLAFTFLIDCGTALNSPSWQASVGDMVPRAKVPAAVALNSMGFNITRSVGPAIGGIIVAAFGPAAAFAVNALSYIGLVTVMARWKRDEPASPLPRESLGAAMGAGLRYVAMSPNIGKVLARGAAFGATSGAVLALLPLVARDVVKGDALTYGIMLGAFGVGAVCGALTSMRLRQMLSSETMVRAAFAGFALCSLDCALSTHAWLTAIGLAEIFRTPRIFALDAFDRLVFDEVIFVIGSPNARGGCEPFSRHARSVPRLRGEPTQPICEDAQLTHHIVETLIRSKAIAVDLPIADDVSGNIVN